MKLLGRALTWPIALALGATPAVARAACDAGALRAAVDEAEAAFGAMDRERFALNLARARTLVGCQPAPVGAADAAHLHGAVALERFLSGDDPGAVQALASALASNPTYTPDPAVAPQGHPLRALLEAAREAPAAGEGEAAAAALLVDGAAVERLPGRRPVVVQQLDEGGEVLRGAYLEGAAAGWMQGREPICGPERRCWPLAAGAGLSLGAAGAGAALYLGARASYQALDVGSDPAQSGYYYDTLRPRFIAGDVLMVAGAAGAAGCGVALWRRGPRLSAGPAGLALSGAW
jgi:hypothetical protein